MPARVPPCGSFAKTVPGSKAIQDGAHHIARDITAQPFERGVALFEILFRIDADLVSLVCFEARAREQYFASGALGQGHLQRYVHLEPARAPGALIENRRVRG